MTKSASALLKTLDSYRLHLSQKKISALVGEKFLCKIFGVSIEEDDREIFKEIRFAVLINDQIGIGSAQNRRGIQIVKSDSANDQRIISCTSGFIACIYRKKKSPYVSEKIFRAKFLASQ